MNERIRQLAELSGFKTNWQHEDVQAIKMARFEKFAQLIVQECANIAHDTQYNHGRASYETGSCARAIRQHFEVEE